ncbi:unnamed protein product [Diabrotica balteata]|uniref:Uncharacterized protein n=1 Tax=Diabrotica balteata TaxID=107213 RepID=A0A9N9XJP7_DIABA|nr:unnamed protein product [Diabrotica balteata]
MSFFDEDSLSEPSLFADNESGDEYFPTHFDQSSTEDERGFDNNGAEPIDNAAEEDKPKRCQKRQINKNKKEQRKRQRNYEQSYTTRTGKVVAQKVFSNPDCNCQNRCFHNIPEQSRKNVFESFWKMGSFVAQNAFLCGLIKQETPKRCRPTTSVKNKKSATNLYHILMLQLIAGKTETVCKKYFLQTFKISDGRMTPAMKKLSLGFSAGEDKRDKKIPGNKTSEEKMLEIRNHIASFPCYQSHYTRSHNPNRKYLSEDLNIRLLYNLYKDKVHSEGKEPVAEHVYRRTFNNEFNLHFHAPHKDTCIKCDIFINKLKQSREEHEKSKLLQDHELHLRKADKVRESMKFDTEKSASNRSYYAFSCDLEKSLSFPRLTFQMAYYKRNLYVYNLGCHELSTEKGFMYCWDEVTGSRGSQEIANKHERQKQNMLLCIAIHVPVKTGTGK